VIALLFLGNGNGNSGIVDIGWAISVEVVVLF